MRIIGPAIALVLFAYSILNAHGDQRPTFMAPHERAIVNAWEQERVLDYEAP